MEKQITASLDETTLTLTLDGTTHVLDATDTQDLLMDLFSLLEHIDPNTPVLDLDRNATFPLSIWRDQLQLDLYMDDNELGGV